MDGDRKQRLRRLGQLLEQARANQGGWPVVSSKAKVGVSKAQWYALTAGDVDRPQAATLSSLEAGFGWTSGSIALFLDGGPEPSRYPLGVTDISEPGARERFLADIRRELSQDQRRELRRQLLEVLAETEGESMNPFRDFGHSQ